MRESRAAIAFVTTYSDARYLLRWSHEWRQWNLVGGHVGPAETPFDAVKRKLASETRLSPRRIHVARTPLFRLRYESVSQRTGEPTAYDVTVFAATLRAKSLPMVTDGQMNLLLTEDEVVEGVGPGGTPVSEMTLRAVDRLREIRAKADATPPREAVPR